MKSEKLKQAQLFSDLPSAVCERLAKLCRLRCLAKNEILFYEQQRGDDMFVLLDGRIQLHKISPDGSVVVIKTVQAGELFGEVVLFDMSVYPVTAEALCATEVCAISRHDLLVELDNRDFRDAWIKMLFSRQRYLAERVRYLSVYDIEERFCLFLKEQYGCRERIRVDLSKQSVAAAISSAPESFSRMLTRLKGEGLLQWKGRDLTVDKGLWDRHEDILI